MNRLSCLQVRSYRFSAEATAMILSDVFERFSRDSPLSVMAQGVMENAMNPPILDQLFEGSDPKESVPWSGVSLLSHAR